jgi:ribosomal protein S18 acetylase RimI-like enzyme
MPELSISYRQASPQDGAFVFDLTERAMRQYVEATWGKWDPEFQLRTHAATYLADAHRIVLVNGTPAGALVIAVTDEHVQLEKLYLLPQFQGQGFGSRVLCSVVDQATDAGKPVRLRVLRVNAAAQRFYLRHGFSVTDTTSERVFMQFIGKPKSERDFAAAQTEPRDRSEIGGNGFHDSSLRS